MDIHVSKKSTRHTSSASVRTSSSLSKGAIHENKSSNYPRKIGSNRVSAVEPSQFKEIGPNKLNEVGESSKMNERSSSSSKMTSKKTTTASAYAPASSTSSWNLKKTRKVHPDAALSSQPSSSRTFSADPAQSGKSVSIPQKGVPKSRVSYGFGENSNFTSSKQHACPVDFRPKTMISSRGKSVRHPETVSSSRREAGGSLGKNITRKESWDNLELFNINDRLPDSFSDRQEHIWMKVDENVPTETEENPCTESLSIADQGISRQFLMDQSDSSASPNEESVFSRYSANEQTSTRRKICSSKDHFNSRLNSKDDHLASSSNTVARGSSNTFVSGSASDILTSSTSSSSSSSSREHLVGLTRSRRGSQCRIVSDSQPTLRNRHSTKHSAVNLSAQKSGQHAQETGPSITSAKAPLTSRRTVRAMQPSTWCSRGISSEDAVIDSGRIAENSRPIPLPEQTGLRSNRQEPAAIRSRRSRNTIGQHRPEDILQGGCSMPGVRMANRLSGSESSGMQNARSRGFQGVSNTPSSSPGEHYTAMPENGTDTNTFNASAPSSSRASASQFPQPRVNVSSMSPLTSHESPVRSLFPLASTPSFSSSESLSSSSFFDSLDHGRSRGYDEDSLGQPILIHSEGSGRRAFRALSVESDSQARYTIEGLAEVLFALERIEQDEELTYEQVLMLEANLVGNGLSFQDQHRDLRLDIDNMSYEELLALEERIGSVNTGLTSDAISKCLTRYSYASDVATTASRSQESEMKCCVCQEEYEEREELGRLKCEHGYHAACISQWLLQKNQCPICKSAAA